MGRYYGNVVMVFGDYDVDSIKNGLRMYYGLTVDTVQTVTESAPYAGEIRTEGNTLAHIAVEIPLKTDLYSKEYVSSMLPLKAVGLTTEALRRANLVLVILKDDDGRASYYPYDNTLYSEEEDYY